MYKILRLCALVAISSLTLSSLTAAAGLEEKDIFFCTKDLDSLQSSPRSVASTNPNNPGHVDIQAYFPLENDKHSILNFRHCFVAFAKVEKKEDSILNLKQVKTYGYGANPDPHEYMKTGDAYQEPGLVDKVVSCVPVFEGSKLSDSSEIYIKWAIIMQAIDDESKTENYNTIGHNCCSVAYYAIEKAGGDLSKVDPSNFNFKGMGILWGQTLGNITDYLTISTFNGITFSASSKSFSSSSSSLDSSSSKSSESKNQNSDEL